ncbi:MAG TPA: DinB family protein [Symbiobacteriaceae bacterium]|nr:DinB family protein [Symbiobacteriaceae bacterium]
MDFQAVPNMNPTVVGIWHVLEFGKLGTANAIKDLTDEQLFAVPAGFRNSIATIIIHVAATEVGLAHTLAGQELPADLRSAYYMGRTDDGLLIEPKGETKESLLAKFDQARALLKEALLKLTDADLDRTLTRANGTQVPMRQLLGLYAAHPALHLGHIQYVKQALAKG